LENCGTRVCPGTTCNLCPDFIAPAEPAQLASAEPVVIAPVNPIAPPKPARGPAVADCIPEVFPPSYGWFCVEPEYPLCCDSVIYRAR
jgi:hypothetical protein